MSPAKLSKAVSSLFGLGYSPIAPGTVGAAGAALFYTFFLSDIGSAGFTIFWAAFTGASVFVCGRAAGAFGEKDPQKIVMDEAAGFFTAMLFCSGETRGIVTGLVLFRIFDIAKIYPSRAIEKLRGGWGIVLDDVYAGFLAALAVAGVEAVG